MSTKLHEANSERIPTYEESQSQSQSHYSPSSSSLTAQLALARISRIDSLITSHILPQIQTQVSSGLHRSTTVLIPSDSGAAVESSAETEASDRKDAAALVPPSLGEVQDLLPSDAHVALIQLSGSSHSAAFWSQAGTADMLTGALRSSLRAQGHKVEDDEAELYQGPQDSTTSTTSANSLGSPTSPPSRRKGPFRRALDAGADSRSDPGVGVLHRRESGGGPDSAAGALGEGKPVKAGWVRVSVESRNVAVRCVSSMGLYETRSGGAVVVRVEIGY